MDACILKAGACLVLCGGLRHRGQLNLLDASIHRGAEGLSGQLLDRRDGQACMGVFFVADTPTFAYDHVGDIRLLAHLEKVDPAGLVAQLIVVAKAGHRACHTLSVVALSVVSGRLRSLKDLDTAVGIEVLVCDEVCAHQILAELAARVAKTCASFNCCRLLSLALCGQE